MRRGQKRRRSSASIGQFWWAVSSSFLLWAACGEASCPAGSKELDGRCEAETGEELSPVDRGEGGGGVGADGGVRSAGGDGGFGRGDGGADLGTGGAHAGGGDAGDDVRCETGFVLLGGACVRDRCIGLPDEPAACAPHGACSEGTERVPECTCDDGYVAEGGACIRNPCVALEGEPAACDQNASCEYTGGGEVICTCSVGFEGDGAQCARNACIQLDHEQPPCGPNQNCTLDAADDKSCACAGDFGDCDAEADNGCEIALSSDAGHCGACGRACADGLACVQGECEQRVTAMSVGLHSMLALTPEGEVLGTGSGPTLHGVAARDTLAELSLEGASGVSVNVEHACLLRADAMGAACWGSNRFYELGSAEPSATYEELPAIGALAISAGRRHTCMISAQGRVYCWGSGADGEFGNGRGPVAEPRTFAETVSGAVGVRCRTSKAR